MRDIQPEEIKFWDEHNDQRYRTIEDCNSIGADHIDSVTALRQYVDGLKYDFGTKLSEVVTLLKILVGIMGCIGGAVAVILVTYLFRGIA